MKASSARNPALLLSLVLMLGLGVFGVYRWTRPAAQSGPAQPRDREVPWSSRKAPPRPAQDRTPRAGAETPAPNNPAEQGNPSPEPEILADGGNGLIDEIISKAGQDFPEAVDQLLAALPQMGTSQQAEAAGHIANLSDSQSMSKWTGALASGRLPQPAAEVLFNDLLNRPHGLGMPVMAAIADQPTHSKSEASREMLTSLYGAPPSGTSWAEWVSRKLDEEQARQ